MPRRTADRISAAVVALWIGLMLRGLVPAYHMMNANDLLTPISNMAGLFLAGVIVMGAMYGVGLIIGLLGGNDMSRFWAVGIGFATALFGVSLLTSGQATDMLSHPWSAAYFLQGCVGGPLLVVVGILGGLTFEAFLPRRGWRRPGGDGGGGATGSGGGGTGGGSSGGAIGGAPEVPSATGYWASTTATVDGAEPAGPPTA